METETFYYLCRDGKKIYRGTSRDDCLRWLHAIQSSSWHHALKYEGYSIEEEKEQVVPDCPDYCPYGNTRQNCKLGTETASKCNSGI